MGAVGVRYSDALPAQGQEIPLKQTLQCAIWIYVSQ